MLAHRGLRFSPKTLHVILTDYRAIKPRSQQLATPTPRPELSTEVKLILYRSEVDAIELRHPDHSHLHVRIDKVLDERRPFWLSAWLAARSATTDSYRWLTLRGWRLPLVPLDAGPWRAPDLGVLQLPTLEEAASLTVALVAAITDNADLMPSLRPEECSPVEASRRAEVSGLILRKRQIARSRSLPQAACLKCGLPLSDPTSVSIGLGPECRKHFSSRDIKDLRSGSPIRKSLIGARSPKQWVRDVSQRYRYLIEPSGDCSS